jgi:drug/metabolite transporter (DMT)-like permease
MRFRTRLYSYVTLALAVAGAFIVVTTFAFDHSTANDIDFAAVIAVTLVAAAAAFIRVDNVLRTVALAMFLISAFTIVVTAGVFDGDTQRWLTFAAAAAVSGLSVAAQAVIVHAAVSPAVRPIAKTEAA